MSFKGFSFLGNKLENHLKGLNGKSSDFSSFNGAGKAGPEVNKRIKIIKNITFSLSQGPFLFLQQEALFL